MHAAALCHPCKQAGTCPSPPWLTLWPPLSPRRDGLHRLTQLIFSKAQPKRLGSQILSGPMLAGLTEAYVNAINNGCVGWAMAGGLRQHGCGRSRVGGASVAAACLLPSRLPCRRPVHHLRLGPLRSAVPTIATAWQGVAEAESRRAGDAAVAAYTETFKEDVSAG